MKKVTIVRGPSGSGKSTFIREVFDGEMPPVSVVSADEFFMVDVGDIGDFIPEGEAEAVLGPLQKEYPDCVREYQFNPIKLGEAHADCFKRFLFAVEADETSIVVDNTNIHTWEYENYVMVAKMHGYAVDVVEFRPITVDDIRTCIARNLHRVPADIVSRMCVQFENCPYAEVMKISE